MKRRWSSFKRKQNDYNSKQRDQAGNEDWWYERRKRVTASKAGSIAKMKNSTKRSNRVKDMLYSTFRGNQATRYGADMETRQQYIAYQHMNGHPDITVENLVYSSPNTTTGWQQLQMGSSMNLVMNTTLWDYWRRKTHIL